MVGQLNHPFRHNTNNNKRHGLLGSVTAWKCTGLANATVDAVQWRVREYLIIAKTRTIGDSPVGVYYIICMLRQLYL